MNGLVTQSLEGEGDILNGFKDKSSQLLGSSRQYSLKFLYVELVGRFFG